VAQWSGWGSGSHAQARPCPTVARRSLPDRAELSQVQLQTGTDGKPIRATRPPEDGCVSPTGSLRTPRPGGERQGPRDEATVGIEPTIRVLQTRALPLGYVALLSSYKGFPVRPLHLDTLGTRCSVPAVASRCLNGRDRPDPACRTLEWNNDTRTVQAGVWATRGHKRREGRQGPSTEAGRGNRNCRGVATLVLRQ
jgi:hypothetical protein